MVLHLVEAHGPLVREQLPALVDGLLGLDAGGEHLCAIQRRSGGTRAVQSRRRFRSMRVSGIGVGAARAHRLGRLVGA